MMRRRCASRARRSGRRLRRIVERLSKRALIRGREMDDLSFNS
jgi:hypothetical protein